MCLDSFFINESKRKAFAFSGKNKKCAQSNDYLEEIII
jgi:hypothetical protein